MMDDNFSFTILCNNVHRSNHISHTILQAHADPSSNTNIIILTEPWIGTIRTETGEKGTAHHPSWTCILPTNTEKAKVSLYYRKSAPFRVTPLAHEAYACNSIIPVRITMGDSFSLLLLAVYNSPTFFTASTILQTISIPEEPTVLCGDFNLHAPDWDNTVLTANARASNFLDWMMNNDLTVLNDPASPTFHGHNFQYAKVDDLIIANATALRDYDLGQVSVHTDRHFASDHYPISIEIFTLTEPETLNPLFKNLLDNMSPIPTRPSLDSLASDIMSAIDTATQQTMKRCGAPCIHKKHWWNESLSEAIAEVRRLGEGVKETHNPYIIRQHDRAKAAFRARVKHAKREWAAKRLEGASSQEMWGFINWYKRSGKRSRPLYSSPSNVPAPDDHARADVFARQFFPDPPPVQPLNIPGDPFPRRHFHRLTFDEVNHAINSCSPNSAPGPSNIEYTAIKWAWTTCSSLLLAFFEQCLMIGHYPAPFKHSTTVVIPKPNKKDYSLPSSFRPIQLLECLGKVLDKIVARRIQFDVACLGIVPTTQFGGRLHSCTTDAGLTLVQDIHDAWSRKQKATALFFDISGFYNFVNHDGLVARLQHYGFDESTVRFVESFLRGRTTSFTYDGFLSNSFPITNGVPQGSPLSSILAIIYGAELQKLRDLIIRRIISLAYVDDGTLLAFSSSLDNNIEKLKIAYGIVSGWLSDNGLKVQPEKLELMHFTRGPDPSSPPFTLPGHNPIVAPKAIRWLGFFLDRHLTFVHHTKVMAARATATIRAMGILGNTVRGMSHTQLRQLTLSTIIPVLIYGSQLWWGGKHSKSNTARLQTALNHALRLITRAFKTSPISALQHIAHIPPIAYTIKKLCYGSSIRFHRLLPDSPVLLRIPQDKPNIRIRHGPSGSSSTIRIPNAILSPLHRIARLTKATSTPTLNPLQDPPWAPTLSVNPRITTTLPPPKEERLRFRETLEDLLNGQRQRNDSLVISTDGSRRSIGGTKRTGAGISVRRGDVVVHEWAIGVGKRTNVYDGESLAIAVAMRFALKYCENRPEITQIYIFSDSAAALTNITRSTAHPSQPISLLFIKAAEAFLLDNSHRIKLHWVPGHSNLEINDRADRLARRGCRENHDLLPTSLSYHAERRSRLVLHEWKRLIKRQPLTGAFGEVTDFPPTIKPSKVFRQLEAQSEVFGRLTQTRTMHGYNTAYYARLNIRPDEFCFCGHLVPPDPSHVRDHTFHICEHYEEHRPILTEVSRHHSPPALLGSTKGLLATAKFLLASGAFTSEGRPYTPPTMPDMPTLDLSPIVLDDPP
jgi:ribonuclease HI